MSRLLIQLAAAALFVVCVWRAFRFAMMMRATRVLREEARQAAEAGGRRVVAEVPTARGELELFAEDAAAFYWLGQAVPKEDIVGGRLLLNGGVMGSAVRPLSQLPEAGTPAEYEGRERWEVRLYLATGAELEVHCGTLREGVSRDAARTVFGAIRSALTLDVPGPR